MPPKVIEEFDTVRITEFGIKFKTKKLHKHLVVLVNLRANQK